ncbi:MAG: DUF1289 domain-containing protein [Alphaproteobacteria bacterium]
MIQSPCIGVCKLDGPYCKGCMRSIREIGGWATYTDEERKAVLERITERETSDA